MPRGAYTTGEHMQVAPELWWTDIGSHFGRSIRSSKISRSSRYRKRLVKEKNEQDGKLIH